MAVSSYRTYADDSRDPGPIEDCVAIIDYVKKMPSVAADSIVVIGHSGGGRLALELCGLPERTGLAAIVCFEPATTLYAQMYPVGMRGPNMTVSRNPERYFTDESRRILKEKVASLSSPIFIVHSDVHSINALNNRYLIPAIKRQEKDLTTKLYGGLPHSFIWGQGVDEQTYKQIIGDVLDFIAAHVKDKPVPVEIAETGKR